MTGRRLKELPILVPTEPGGWLFLVAELVARLLTHRFEPGSNLKADWPALLTTARNPGFLTITAALNLMDRHNTGFEKEGRLIPLAST